MKRFIGVLLAGLMLCSFVSIAAAQPWHVKGDYYAGTAGTWNHDAGNLLYDDGAHGDGAAGDGLYGGTVTSDQAGGRKEFKIADPGWTASYPVCNSWLHSSGVGDAIHFTFDTRVHSDGWLPTTNVVWSDHYAPPGTSFEVIGSAAETGAWASGVAAEKKDGSPMWELVVTVATPAAHEAKFRAVGTWDICNIGPETNTPCAPNLAYTTTQPNQKVQFKFDSSTGRARVLVLGATPAVSPALLSLLALALVGAGFFAVRRFRAAGAVA